MAHVDCRQDIKENSFKISKAVNEYVQTYGTEPTVNMLCEKTGLAKEDIVLAMEASAEVESIYKTTGSGDENERFLVDRLAGETKEEDKIVNRVLLRQLLDTLSGTDKELLNLCFILEITQVQVAKKLGISQVQVSRMEKKILMGLRKIASP